MARADRIVITMLLRSQAPWADDDARAVTGPGLMSTCPAEVTTVRGLTVMFTGRVTINRS